jgi:hypothetical protein
VARKAAFNRSRATGRVSEMMQIRPWFVLIEEARFRGGGSVQLPGGVPGCAVR